MASLRWLKRKLQNEEDEYDRLDAEDQQLKSEYTTLHDKETFYRTELHKVSGADQKWEIESELEVIEARMDEILLRRDEIEQQLESIDEEIQKLEKDIGEVEQADRAAASPEPPADPETMTAVADTAMINPLHKALLSLDYAQHIKYFQDHFPDQQRGVVLLGAPEAKRQYGLKLLVKRLCQSIPELQPEKDGKQIRNHRLPLSVARLDGEGLWEQLGTRLSDTLLSRQEIGHRIGEQLLSQHVVIEVHDQNKLFTGLDDILQNFWQPLVVYADLKLQDVANPGLLILLLVDYCQQFVEAPEMPEVVSLFVDRFDKGDVVNWYYLVQSTLPRALKRPYCNDDLIWDQSNEGIPDDLLDYVSKTGGYYIQRLLEE